MYNINVKEVLRNIEIKDTNSKRKKLIIEDLGDCLKIYYKNKIGHPVKPILLNNKLVIDKSFAEFVGFIEAEGDHDLEKKSSFCIANTNKEIINSCIYTISKIFKRPRVTYRLILPKKLQNNKNIILKDWIKAIKKKKIRMLFDTRRSIPAMNIMLSGILYPRLIKIFKDLVFKHHINKNKELFNHYIKAKFLGDGHFYLSKSKYPVFTISYAKNEKEIAMRDRFLINKFYNIDLSQQKSSSENCFLLRTYNILDIYKISAHLNIKKIPHKNILNIIRKNFNLLYANIDNKTVRYGLFKSIQQFSNKYKINYWTVSAWKYGDNKIPLYILIKIFKRDKLRIYKIIKNINIIQMERKGILEINDSFDKYLFHKILNFGGLNYARR